MNPFIKHVSSPFRYLLPIKFKRSYA